MPGNGTEEYFANEDTVYYSTTSSQYEKVELCFKIGYLTSKKIFQ